MRGRPSAGLALAGALFVGVGVLVQSARVLSFVVVMPLGVVLIGIGIVFVILAVVLSALNGPLPIETANP